MTIRGYAARIVNGIVWARLDMGLGRPEWVAVGDVLRPDERRRMRYLLDPKVPVDKSTG